MADITGGKPILIGEVPSRQKRVAAAGSRPATAICHTAIMSDHCTTETIFGGTAW